MTKARLLVRKAGRNPVTLMRIACRLLRERQPLVAAWLTAGLAEHVDTGEDIGAALGFCAPDGARSPRTLYLLGRRDRLLRAALGEVGGSYARLAREVAAFERLPSQLKENTPRHGSSRLRRFVHEAWRVGLGVPATAPGLRYALASDTATKTKASEHHTLSGTRRTMAEQSITENRL